MSAKPPWRNYVANTDPWLDDGALQAIRRELPALADEVLSAIQRDVPEYARPLSGEFGRGIRSGTELALLRFIGDERDPASENVYSRLGAGEYRAGRSLDALQSAYRIGARVAWRRMSETAEAAGATPSAQRSLAEAMFAYIDRLASESVEGYARAQLSDAGDLDRWRTHLAEGLLGGSFASEAELNRAAELARWPVPRTIACLAVAGPLADRAGRQLSGETLSVELGGATGLIAPHPVRIEEEASRLAERLELRLGVGPAVVLGDAGRSMQLARRALELTTDGVRVAVAERRLSEIALNAVPDVLAALRDQLLAPFETETPASRERLEETLLHWLRHRGSQSALAAQLAIHPQTARYRIRRLRELFGPALDDPDERFALEMALRFTRAGARAPVAPASAP